MMRETESGSMFRDKLNLTFEKKIIIILPNYVVSPILNFHPEDCVMANGNSAASQHYRRQEDIDYL